MDNELYHFGVKGMHWGVRNAETRARYRNERRELKTKLKAEKKATKLNNYRDRLVKKADSKRKYNSAKAKDYKYELEDLKKRGESSSTFRLEKERRYQEAAQKDYNEGGTIFNVRHRQEVGYDYLFNSKNILKEMIDDRSSSFKYHSKKAREWSSRKKGLMDTTISEMTTKKDIKRIYKGK